MERIAVIIPAFNEQDAIEKVVASVHSAAKQAELSYWPVVVNDKSTDHTAEIIERLECTALQLPINLGIGGAVQTGFKYALQAGFDKAIQIDGDGQHPPTEIAKVYHAMQQGGYNVMIGSRFIDGSGFQSTFMRRVGIKYFMWLNKLLLGKTIYDNTSGMRMLDRKALELVSEYYPDEYPEPESAIIYVKSGLKLGEVQVNMLERQGGVSSIGGASSVYYMLKVTLAILYTYFRLSWGKK